MRRRYTKRLPIIVLVPWLLLTLFSGAMHNHPLISGPAHPVLGLCDGLNESIDGVRSIDRGHRECLACTWLLSSCGGAPASPDWIASPSISPICCTCLPSPYSPSPLTISVRGPPSV